jgi:hypothetical protein
MTTHEIVSETNAIVEIHPLYAELACKQRVIEGPKQRARCVAHTWCTVAGNAVRLPEHVGQATLLHGRDIGCILSEVTSDIRLGHEVLQDNGRASAKRAAVVVLREPATGF